MALSSSLLGSLSFAPALPLVRVAGGFFDAGEITEAFQHGLSIESAATRYVVWVLAAALLLAGGVVSWRKRVGAGLAQALFFAAAAIVGGVIPSLPCEGARVTPEVLRVRSGLWFSAQVQEVRLADVVRIEEGQERPTTGKMKLLMTIWYFQMKDGRWERVPLPKLVATHREVAARYLARHGHTVVVVNRGQ